MKVQMKKSKSNLTNVWCSISYSTPNTDFPFDKGFDDEVDKYLETTYRMENVNSGCGFGGRDMEFVYQDNVDKKTGLELVNVIKPKIKDELQNILNRYPKLKLSHFNIYTDDDLYHSEEVN